MYLLDYECICVDGRGGDSLSVALDRAYPKQRPTKRRTGCHPPVIISCRFAVERKCAPASPLLRPHPRDRAQQRIEHDGFSQMPIEARLRGFLNVRWPTEPA